MNKRIGLFFLLTCLLANSVYAKRFAPPVVEPLQKGDYIYAKGGDGYTYFEERPFHSGYDSYGILIESINEPKFYFFVPLYTIKLNPDLETDAQWCEIKSMEFKDEETIIVINERDQVFEFNINTYEVKNLSKVDDSITAEFYDLKYKRIIEGNAWHKYKGTQPKKKKLSKVEDVVALAEEILFPLFGEDWIRKEQPYIVRKYKNKWYVKGSKSANSVFGVFEIVITADTSQIESVVHWAY